MVATTIRSIKALAHRLSLDYPEFVFVESDHFKWSAAHNTISFAVQKDSQLLLLHELAHALLKHDDYRLDIELIIRERDAWQLTQQSLAPHYGITFNPEVAQDALESYRDWLYARSLCPACGQTGLQIKVRIYQCLNCRCPWHPNDAQQQALRRYVL